MKSKSKKKKILFIVLSIMAVLIVAGDWALSAMVYNENFNQRFESYEPLMFYVDDFDQLQRTKYEFASNKGHNFYLDIAGAGTVFAVYLHTIPK